MIDFNEIPNDSNNSFELIPAGTVARVVLTMKRGPEVISDYSTQPLFKQGQTGTKWLECEFTVVGGKTSWLMVVRLIQKVVCLGVKRLVSELLEISSIVLLH
jgi:hypothetical protein